MHYVHQMSEVKAFELRINDRCDLNLKLRGKHIVYACQISRLRDTHLFAHDFTVSQMLLL